MAPWRTDPWIDPRLVEARVTALEEKLDTIQKNLAWWITEIEAGRVRVDEERLERRLVMILRDIAGPGPLKK